MKKTVILAALTLIAMAGTAMADTNALTVNAQVVGTCKFSTATSTLSFGTLDQTLTTPATAQTIPTFWCTKGATATITSNDGANALGTQKRLKSGTDYIDYSLTLAAASTTGAGKTSPIDLTIDGTIANAAYVNAPAGIYSDTVLINITP
jgi:hypothetical protein